MRRTRQDAGLFATLPDAAPKMFDVSRAAKVLASEWTGGAVWSDEANAHFESIDHLKRYYASTNQSMPQYVWECVEAQAGYEKSAELAVDFIMKDEDAFTPEPVDDLTRFIDYWLRENQIRLMHWVKDNKRVVIL